MNASVSLKRSRSFWPLALGLAGQPVSGITPEHMRLAREMTECDGSTHNQREATRGSRFGRLVQRLLQGLEQAGRAHAATRGLMLQ